MSNVIKFPSIASFREVIATVRHISQYTGEVRDGQPVYDESRPLATLDYVGRVKLHGMNSSVAFFEDGSHQVQSREVVLTPEDDATGFARFVQALPDTALTHLREAAMAAAGERATYPITVYGEWCGQGVQKGVGVSKLPKMFAVFGVLVGHRDPDNPWNETWVDVDRTTAVSLPELRIYHVDSFGRLPLSIDFSAPAKAAEILTEVTTRVGEQCPVANALGAEGKGEGWVWMPVDPKLRSNPRLWFKTKAEEHKQRKTSGADEVDPEKAAKLESARAVVDEFLTEARLERGLSYLAEAGKPLEMKSTGDFVRWVTQDIIKDASAEMPEGVTAKDVGSAASKLVSAWYIKKMDELAGL
jgi:hypothetical protein